MYCSSIILCRTTCKGISPSHEYNRSIPLQKACLSVCFFCHFVFPPYCLGLFQSPGQLSRSSTASRPFGIARGPAVQRINLLPKLRRQICRRDWTWYRTKSLWPNVSSFSIPFFLDERYFFSGQIRSEIV